MPSRPPSLRAIAAFESAARHESFAKAAQELNLTQSAISHAIRGLEDRLGVALFDRNGRAVALTPDGGRFAERVRLSLMILAEAMDAVPRLRSPSKFVLGAPGVFLRSVLLPWWGALTEAFQLTEMSLSSDVRLEALPPDLPGAVVHYGPSAPAGHGSRLISQDLLLPVAAPDLASRPAEELGVIENSVHPWSLWERYVGAPASRRPAALVVEDWGAAIEAARGGLGRCLAPQTLLLEALRSGELVELGGGRMPGVNGFFLVWRRSAAGELCAEQLADWLHARLEAQSFLAGGQARAA